jgi:Cupin-like domain
MVERDKLTPMSKTIEYCRSIPIERTKSLAVEVFHQRYLSGFGKPVIVTDAMSTWRAPSKWTFDMFKDRYGSEGVVASIWSSQCKKIMTLGDYIGYLDATSGRSPGFWIDPATNAPRSEPPEVPAGPLYLSGWRAFNLHPELLEDVQLSPKFVEDLLPSLPEAFRNVLDEATRYFAAGVLIGPPASVAVLHYDFLHTHAYLAQIVGRKRCMLFSPEDSAALYDGQVELDHPDLCKFPLLHEATAFECILEPGELLFIPSRWWHHVVAIEKSITVNYNFFNRVNFSAYITDLLRDLPSIANALAGSPQARAALDIRWTTKDFGPQS